ncbi:hypothetical protein OF83DRAFT_1171016 [Amylostereum chailletii]|nr:hypothetical protein OF83DRAFT_1171016 [Amylostereum chailletii]
MYPGVEPQFGLFYNYCLNFPRPSAKILDVYCKPHIDWKNLAVGVCLLFVHGKFDHNTKAWLVIWEAGIIIQIPPGVFVAYPSSLFYHFNWDISTSDGSVPTQKTAEPLDGKMGRRSSVWFNQSSMFQTAELGYNSVKAAEKAGIVDTSCDTQGLISNSNLFPRK